MFDLLVMHDTHLFALLVLAMFTFIITQKNDLNEYRNRILLVFFLVAIILIIIELGTFLVNDKLDPISKVMNYFLNYLLLFLIPFLSGIWASYIDYVIFESKDRLKKNFYYLYPVVMVTILLLINTFYPILFSINEQNHFVKESFHFLMLLTMVVIYIHIWIVVIKNKNKVKSTVVWSILSFAILPFMFEIIELYFGELPYTFIAVGYSLCFNYLILETVSASHDYMTGLYTRRKAMSYQRSLLKKKMSYTIIVIDLDDFKYINDTFGHYKGDQAINEFSFILNQVYSDNGLVSRLGGDEFLIVSLICENNLIIKKMSQIRELIKHEDFEYGMYLDFSYGLAHCEEVKNQDEDMMIHLADERMYMMKKDRKEKKIDG